MIKITLDKFFEDYKPQVNHILRAKVGSHIADEDIAPYAGCMYETFGEEIDYIKSFFNKPKHIWTIVDGEDDMVIQSGYWLVNRLGYIITEKPWEKEDILVED
jgi:hypothetical protein